MPSLKSIPVLFHSSPPLPYALLSPFGAPGWKGWAGASKFNPILAKFSPKNVGPQFFYLSVPFYIFYNFDFKFTMKPKDFIQGNTSWEHFCNRLGAGSFNHRSLLRTIFGLKVAHRFSFDRVFLQGSTFLTPIRWTLKFWEVYLGRLHEDGFAKLSH